MQAPLLSDAERYVTVDVISTEGGLLSLTGGNSAELNATESRCSAWRGAGRRRRAEPGASER